MSHVLIHLPYSAWSRRTRQALAVEGIEHRRRVYTPTLGEPALRWQTGRWRRPVHVPVLLPDDGPAVCDSTEIAAWASARGSAELLPERLREPIADVVALAERCLAAGRVRTTHRVIADPVALRESLPPPLDALGPLGVPIAATVARGIVHKYGGGVPGDADRALEDAIGALAARVGDCEHLFEDRLTWADLAAASALVFVQPPADLKVGPHTRAAFTHASLAEAHSPLVAWRDRIDAIAAAHPGGR